jgi:hypothetical protein
MSNIVVEPPGSRQIASTFDFRTGERGDASISVGRDVPQRRFKVKRAPAPSFDEGSFAPSQRREVYRGPSARQQPEFSRRGAPPMQRRDVSDLLGDFANPSKAVEFEEEFDEGDGAGGVEEAPDEFGEEYGEGGDGHEFADGEDMGPEDEFGVPPPEESLGPSPGFATIEDEKSDLLFKIQRYKKQGRFVSKAFTIFSDVRELRSEVARIRTDVDLESSIKFQRKLLIAFCTAIEKGNEKFKLADVYLDGWSAHVNGEIETYDDVFEELFHKYRGKSKIPPELNLILMVGGSGLMYSMSHKFFAAAMPHIQKTISENPDLVQNMAAAYARTSGQDGGAAPGANAVTLAAERAAEARNGGPRPMRGPGIDLSAMLNPLGGGLGFPPPGGNESGGPFLAPPAFSRKTDAVENKAFAVQKADEDRFSDVISEDLESLPSVSELDQAPGEKRKIALPSSGGGGKRAKKITV